MGSETRIFFVYTPPPPSQDLARVIFAWSVLFSPGEVYFIFAISLLSKSLAQHTFAKSTFLISYIGWDILLLFARGSILVWLWFNLSHVSYFQNYSLLAYKRR